MSKAEELAREYCRGCNNFSRCNFCMDGEEWAYKEEKGSEELEKEIENFFDRWMEDPEYNQAVMPNYQCAGLEDCRNIARHFANWQKENLWKPADGDDLPEIDREVIALVQDYPDDKDHLRVAFAHRPPEYWDGKDIVTGKVTRNYPKTYDKGGWNISNVKWWLDCSLPNLEEE